MKPLGDIQLIQIQKLRCKEGHVYRVLDFTDLGDVQTIENTIVVHERTKKEYKLWSMIRAAREEHEREEFRLACMPKNSQEEPEPEPLPVSEETKAMLEKAKLMVRDAGADKYDSLTFFQRRKRTRDEMEAGTGNTWTPVLNDRSIPYRPGYMDIEFGRKPHPGFPWNPLAHHLMKGCDAHHIDVTTDPRTAQLFGQYFKSG